MHPLQMEHRFVSCGWVPEDVRNTLGMHLNLVGVTP